jgi:hypothetical protein
VLAATLGVPIADPPSDDLHPRVVEEIPSDFATRWLVFPLGLRREPRGDNLVVAMSDPTNFEALDALRFHTGKVIHVALAGDTAIESWIRRFYFGDTSPEPAQVATIQQAQQALAGVQFGGHTVDLDDDIPLVTGAIVSSPTPPPAPTPLPPPTQAPPPTLADPFAAFARATAVATSPVDIDVDVDPFAALNLAPVEVAASRSEAGRHGFSELAPLAPPPAAEWDAHVPVGAAPTVAPLPVAAPVSMSAPVFAPAGGFLGEPEDELWSMAPAGGPVQPTLTPTPVAAFSVPAFGEIGRAHV